MSNRTANASIRATITAQTSSESEAPFLEGVLADVFFDIELLLYLINHPMTNSG
jgi:hypothetical protein